MIFSKISNFNKIFFGIFFFCLFLFFFSIFSFYRKQELKNNINKLIIEFNKDSKNYHIEDFFKINISKNPFSSKVEIKNLQITVLDSLKSEMKSNFSMFGVIDRIILENLELKVSLNKILRLEPRGLNKIIYSDSNNQKLENFFQLDSKFQIKTKENHSNKDLLGLIEFFEYKDQKLKIFNNEKKLIYETDLFNQIEILNKKDCNFLVDIQKNKLIPFNLSANVLEQRDSENKKIIYKISDFKLDVLESKIDISGQIFTQEDQILNQKETQDFFPEGLLKISIKHFENILYFLSFFAKPEQVHEVKNFINEFSIKKDQIIYFEYKKEKNEKPKLNEKEFLENLDYKKIFDFNLDS
jgi:hypothetical protein